MVTLPQASDVCDRVGALVGRLNAGWRLIEAETDPVRKARLEDHWIALLRAYEAAISGDAEGSR